MKIDKTETGDKKIMNKNKKKIYILIGVILALIILIFADKAFKSRQSAKNNDKNGTESKLTLEGVSGGESAEGENTESTDDSTGTENTTEGTQNSETTDNGDEAVSNTSTVYEYWLAAGAVTGVSMYYPGFELQGIYLASETPLGNHGASKGVYVVFTLDGETKTIQSLPLDEERSEAGTIDLSTQNFGLATFDFVEVSDAELKACTEITIESISDLIGQLMLVTLYEH